MVAESPGQVVELLDRAFNQGDVATLLSYYEDAAVVMTEPGNSARGQHELKVFFERVLQSGASAKQLKTYVIEADGVALFLSRWTLKLSGDGPDTAPRTFTATTVLRKQPDGGWKALIDNAFGPQVLGAD